MNEFLSSFDGVHDYYILSYFVDFTAHTITFETKTSEGQRGSICFHGVLNHHFECIGQDNILFGIDELAIEYFFEKYKNLLNDMLPYGFPAPVSRNVLEKQMREEKIRIFEISASLGLSGFILAKEIRLLEE